MCTCSSHHTQFQCDFVKRFRTSSICPPLICTESNSHRLLKYQWNNFVDIKMVLIFYFILKLLSEWIRFWKLPVMHLYPCINHVCERRHSNQLKYPDLELFITKCWSWFVLGEFDQVHIYQHFKNEQLKEENACYDIFDVYVQNQLIWRLNLNNGYICLAQNQGGPIKIIAAALQLH